MTMFGQLIRDLSLPIERNNKILIQIKINYLLFLNTHVNLFGIAGLCQECICASNEWKGDFPVIL